METFLLYFWPGSIGLAIVVVLGIAIRVVFGEKNYREYVDSAVRKICRELDERDERATDGVRDVVRSTILEMAGDDEDDVATEATEWNQERRDSFLQHWKAAEIVAAIAEVQRNSEPAPPGYGPLWSEVAHRADAMSDPAGHLNSRGAAWMAEEEI